MATLPFFAVALLAICMVIPTALSLQCYVCSSHPQFFGGSSCNSDNVTKITCLMLHDRCFTMKAMMSNGVGGKISTELRNCTVNQLCNPQSPYNLCKMYNSSGMALTCMSDCCASDLCNVESSTSIPPATAVSPTASVVQSTPSVVQSTPSVVQSTPSVVQSTTPKPISAVLALAPSFCVIFSALILSNIVGIN